MSCVVNFPAEHYEKNFPAHNEQGQNKDSFTTLPDENQFVASKVLNET